VITIIAAVQPSRKSRRAKCFTKPLRILQSYRIPPQMYMLEKKKGRQHAAIFQMAYSHYFRQRFNVARSGFPTIKSLQYKTWHGRLNDLHSTIPGKLLLCRKLTTGWAAPGRGSSIEETQPSTPVTWRRGLSDTSAEQNGRLAQLQRVGPPKPRQVVRAPPSTQTHLPLTQRQTYKVC